ncbi:uncharacterized protein LOC111717411 [Eurytemora carolleeae]|uniref:uncharacterized protein LOC111717411 n=1 Tax=Eurytemora carolleeae TaxID=1294199 RepID=UPI000C774B6F|nr:uncharacterized protein LOC111717411 [Eurytemora carolleeae]|eukprot:XP_023348680.1 uncharacterized protein LOC111717411 [Eurytemora affinis]
MKQSFALERRVVKPDGKVEVLMDGMKKSKKIGDVLEEPTEDFNTPDQRENITIEETLVRPKPENPTDKWLQMIEDDAEKEEKKRESAGKHFNFCLKEMFLFPGHDRVVTIESRNISIAKIWCWRGFCI